MYYVCVWLGPADVKPAASRVLSPSQTHQTVKPQTTAGILSKTISTVTQKRVAHTPTMKVYTGRNINKMLCCWLSFWIFVLCFCVCTSLHNHVSWLADAGCLSKEKNLPNLNLDVIYCQCSLSVFNIFQSSSMKRPVIPTEFGAKVPTNVRQRYLNTFIDECVKFCPSEDVAFQMVWITPSVHRFYGLQTTLSWIQRRFNKCFSWTSCGFDSDGGLTVSGPWRGEAGVWSQ